MKKNLIVIVLMMIGCLTANAQNDDEYKEIVKAATDMIYDAAHGSISHFNLLKPEETSLLFMNSQAAEGWAKTLSDKQAFTDVFNNFKSEGVKKGIDWNDITITDIRYWGDYDSEWGAEEIRGHIYLNSNGMPFDIFFKRCFFLNGKCRMMLLSSIDQTDEKESNTHTGRNP